jgi:hypothetical protein
MTRTVVQYGLAPSGSLAPSNTLAPADTIYTGGPITPHQIWLEVVPGGIADVSAWVEFGQGVSYTYGRQTQFDDVGPSTLTFTLNNSDGRFTPDNPASPYTKTLQEGSAVKWVMGSRLMTLHVLSIEIPSNEDQWDQIVVTCDDMLGTAARHQITSIPDALLEYAQAKAVWKLDDDSDQQFGKESMGDPLGPFSLYRSNPNSTTDAVTFGVQQALGLPGTAVTVTAAPGETNWFGTRHGNTVRNTNITSPGLGTGTSGQVVEAGWWSFWVYPGSTINFAVVPVFGVENPGYAWSAQIQCTPSTYTVKPGAATGVTYGLSAAEQLTPHYIEMRFRLVWQTSGNYWAFFTTMFVDGVSRGQTSWYDPQHGFQVPAYVNSLSPVEVSVSVTTQTGAAAPLSGTVQRVAYSTNGGGQEYTALRATLDGRRKAVDVIAQDVSTELFNGLPLSTAPIGFPDDTNTTVLDLLNAVTRTEAGHLFPITHGTVANSTTSVNVRSRTRPNAPEATFDVSTELDGPPTFVRDITNVAAQVDVAGPTQTVTVADATITGRYVTASTSETVLYTKVDDLRLWGQDRLNRGKNRAVRAQQFTVDAVTTPSDRSVDLLALLPGDRVQLSSTPVAHVRWEPFHVHCRAHNTEPGRVQHRPVRGRR